MTDASGRAPAAPQEAPPVFATVDSPALSAPGLRLLTAAMMDLEGPGQCRPSLGSTHPGRLSLSNNAGAGIDARARARG